jgi:hypothetical protein
LRGGEVRIGLIADIHGKLFAVEIDLAELVKEDLDVSFASAMSLQSDLLPACEPMSVRRHRWRGPDEAIVIASYCDKEEGEKERIHERSQDRNT